MNEPDQHHPRGAMSSMTFCSLGRHWPHIRMESEIREGRLRAVKVSVRTIVIVDDARAWLTSRPPVASATQNFS